jgi:hypothetical protein
VTIRELHKKLAADAMAFLKSHHTDECDMSPCLSCQIAEDEYDRHCNAVAAIDRGVRQYGINGVYVR